MQQVFKLWERESPQIKELRLLYESSPTRGVYKLFTQWPGYPGFDTYYRIIYDQDDHSIKALDFDGGPMIYSGFVLDKNNKIVNIHRDAITQEFLVDVQYEDDVVN